ncbi:hypothetical protein ACLOJK_019018 [Asimina triloba]
MAGFSPNHKSVMGKTAIRRAEIPNNVQGQIARSSSEPKTHLGTEQSSMASMAARVQRSAPWQIVFQPSATFIEQSRTNWQAPHSRTGQQLYLISGHLKSQTVHCLPKIQAKSP